MNTPDINVLRKKFLASPPEGFTKRDIQQMSNDEILDMNYFLNEDDPFEELDDDLF